MRLLDGNPIVSQSQYGAVQPVTKGTTALAPNHKRHAVTADGGRWRLLGELLQGRRQELGFKFRPAFARERLPLTDDGNPNTRLVADIENAYDSRINTFPAGTLRLLAGAYEATYDSVLAVLAGKADALVPAAPAAPPDDSLPLSPARAASDRPWYREINERRVALAARGITDPDGAQMFPDRPDDAKAWDGIGARLDIDARVWFIADLRRRAAGRAGRDGSSGTVGA
jgi:hypothetical protein